MSERKSNRIPKESVCFACKEKLAVATLGLDDILFCANEMCPRLGLLTVLFAVKTKTKPNAKLKTPRRTIN